jgi:hypothetical protein
LIIYHFTRKDDLLKFLDAAEYTGDTLKTEGFIHCFTTDQGIDVVNIVDLSPGDNGNFVLPVDKRFLIYQDFHAATFLPFLRICNGIKKLAG